MMMLIDRWFMLWAQNKKSPGWLLSILSHAHHNRGVRYWVSLNRSTPIRTLRYLSIREKDKNIYGSIRQNISCPEDIALYVLARLLRERL